ncbi:hypothetical protein HJFPF1_05168 [Paramyrothecium foliicola]|nr:hypothetical protein HJFPF1_05168 [Paramyrothecium foliicola]
MNDTAVGLDSSVEWKESHGSMTAKDADGRNKQLELSVLLVRQRAVVYRGTTCFVTRQGVAQFSWRSSKRPSEVKNLKQAWAQGMDGVVASVARREITSTGDLRTGSKLSSSDEATTPQQPESAFGYAHQSHKAELI